MAREIVPLADILSKEEMRALAFCDLSPEVVIKKFVEHPEIEKMEYNKEEERFYVTFADGEVANFKFLLFLPNREDA